MTFCCAGKLYHLPYFNTLFCRLKNRVFKKVKMYKKEGVKNVPFIMLMQNEWNGYYQRFWHTNKDSIALNQKQIFKKLPEI